MAGRNFLDRHDGKRRNEMAASKNIMMLIAGESRKLSLLSSPDPFFPSQPRIFDVLGLYVLLLRFIHAFLDKSESSFLR